MPRTSTAGTIEDALAHQAGGGIQERFRGPWFHVTQNPALEAFTDEEEDWTFFTRSPLGGAIWGRHVIQVVVTAPAINSRLYASGHGDPLGKEAGRELPDWWLLVGRDDIDKLMVVRKYHLVNDEAVAIALRDSPEFQSLRQAAIARLPAPPQE